METFLADVHRGLSTKPKSLPSKYFYDAIGDDLFVQIMAMPEYYLTRAEMEILSRQAADIIRAFGQPANERFELIELGAGDGSKTQKLLEELLRQEYEFDYVPIDISENAVEGLSKRLKNELPNLSIMPRVGDYFEILAEENKSDIPKVVLFLGSNIGNLLDKEAHDFLERLAANMHRGDRMLLGVDLIKEVERVLPAYNDAKGITRDFNLNLLSRINRELGGDFNIDNFRHVAEYTEEEGIARSYLVSTKEQAVTLKSNGESYFFEEGERLGTEVSRKYNDKIIAGILLETDLEIRSKFTDRNGLFANYLLQLSLSKEA